MDKSNLDHLALEKCRSLIETKLDWGSSEDWHTKDFINLSEEIYLKTKVKLSDTTLKRIWGRVKYNNFPSVSTLDVLAGFLDYDSWRSFKASNLPSSRYENSKILKPQYFKKKKWFLAVLMLAIFTLGIIFFLPGIISTGKILFQGRDNSEDIVFESKIVESKGFPKTVIFDVDLNKKITDNVEIKLSWADGHRVSLASDQKTATGIYYSPGVYKARLMVNNETVKEQYILISSDAWFASLKTENGRFIRYLNSKIDTSQQQFIALKDNYESVLKTEAPVNFVYYDYVPPFEDIDSESFALRATLENTSFGDDTNICQYTMVSIYCEEGYFYVPFSKMGCVSKLFLNIGTRSIDWNTHDLSYLGIDLNLSHDVVFQNQGKAFTIIVDGQHIDTFTYQEDVGKILGVTFIFEGGGKVTNFSIDDNPQFDVSQIQITD